MGTRIGTVFNQNGQGEVALSEKQGKSEPAVGSSVVSSPRQRPQDEFLADICPCRFRGVFKSILTELNKNEFNREGNTAAVCQAFYHVLPHRQLCGSL